MARSTARFAILIAVITLALSACDSQHPLEPTGAGGDFAVAGDVFSSSATPISATRIDVSWTDQTRDENGFELYRSTTGGTGSFSLQETVGANVTSYSNAGLTASTQYCYKVRSFQITGKKTTYSGFSAVACATTLAPQPPSAPSGVDARPQGNQVLIGWTDNSTDEKGFRVESSIDDLATWSPVVSLNPNVTTTFQGPPALEQSVCYRVVAFNDVGTSTSNVDCTAVPESPSDLTAVGAGSAINLNWVDRSAVEGGYWIMRAPVGGSFAELVVLPANATSYRDASAVPDVRYVYSLRATRDGGFSFVTTADGIVAATPPASPSQVIASGNGSTSMWVGWTDGSSNEEGFRVERSTDGGASWTVAGTASWSSYNSASFSDAVVPSETRTCYRVTAFNSAGNSAPSSIGCATLPAAPTAVTATALAGGTAIDLAWTDNSGVEDGYEVYRYVEECSYYDGCYMVPALIATVGANVTTFREEAWFVPGVTFTYYVVAIKQGNRSDPSNTADATPGGGPR
jgi:hypothetical protein